MSAHSNLLARGELNSPPGSANIQLTVTDGRTDAVVEEGLIYVIPQDDTVKAWSGRVILRRGNRVVLEPLKELGAEARQKLRVPVRFESFAYPQPGGRVPILSNDLSCGGISFYAVHSFALHELFQVVVPITDEGPLLLDAEILRREEQGRVTLYASRFSNLCPDEEARVQSAVFQVQIEERDAAPARK